MAYKHVIRAKTKNLMTDDMFTSAGFTKQPDGSWYVPDSVVLNNKVMWENTEGIAGPITMSFYGRSSAPYYAGVAQWLVEAVDGTIAYRTPTGTSSEWVYGTWTFDSKTVSKVYWVNISNRPLYLRDVMFEWGSTPTPYTPYNYLQSNKRMIKVSEVCQLLDKSKYNLPHTESGLTFTAGTDGSIIVNGTCTSTVWANISSFELNPEHTFILIGCPGTNVNDVALYTQDPVIDKVLQWEEGRGSLVTGNWYKNKANYLYIRILTGYVCNNLTFKPQLYDLTEMYGAGHEPATVAEFRQRFPNELYPYYPQCWLTSYKSAVVCKTKNLFDVNKITESTNLKNNKDGTITVSIYGVSGGLLKNLCPELKVGDVIKVYFQPLRWTAPKPPLVMVVGGVVFDRNGNTRLTVTEKSLNKPVWFYNNDYDERGLPGTTIIGNILITTDLTITNKNHNERYTPYQHL